MCVSPEVEVSVEAAVVPRITLVKPPVKVGKLSLCERIQIYEHNMLEFHRLFFPKPLDIIEDPVLPAADVCLDAAKSEIMYLSGADDMDLLNVLKQEKCSRVMTAAEAKEAGFFLNQFLVEQGFNYVVVESAGGEMEESPLPPGIYPAGTDESAEAALTNKGISFTRLNQMDYYENGYLDTDKFGLSSEATVEMDLWSPVQHFLETLKEGMKPLDHLKSTDGKSIFDEGVICNLDDKYMTPEEKAADKDRDIRWHHIVDFLTQLVRWCDTGWGPAVESYLNEYDRRIYQFAQLPAWETVSYVDYPAGGRLHKYGVERYRLDEADIRALIYSWRDSGIQFNQRDFRLSVKLAWENHKAKVVPNPKPLLIAAWNYLWGPGRRIWIELNPKKNYFDRDAKVWREKNQPWISETVSPNKFGQSLHLIRFAFKFLLEYYEVPKQFWPDIHEDTKTARVTREEENLTKLRTEEIQLLKTAGELDPTRALLDPVYAKEMQHQALEITRKFNKVHERIATSESQLEYEMMKLAKEEGFDLGVSLHDIDFGDDREFSQDDRMFILAEMRQVVAPDMDDNPEPLEF